MVAHLPIETTTPELLKMLSPMLGFISGFLTAVFAEPLRQWLYRPKLALSFGSTSDFITRTPEVAGSSQHEAFYIRIKVVNSRSRLAKACRAYLVGVEKQGADGAFRPTIYCDSIQLAWAVKGDQAYGAVDLPRDVVQFVDVVSTRSISPHFKPEIRPLPMRYIGLFQENGVFRFRVQVSGDGVKPATVQLILNWSGTWDTFRAEA